MKIELENGKPKTVEASYSTYLEFDVSDLDIDWSKVKAMWCKYGTLEIEMEDEHISLAYSSEGETDYKWPISLKLLNDDYDILWEE